MIIKNEIKLGTIQYFIKVECIYKKKDNSYGLYLKNYSNDYFDGGDLSLLIEELETKYDYKKVEEQYKSNISFINDALYIYDNIPFISGLGDIFNKSESFISKEELDVYIKDNNVKMKDNSKFELYDQRTWNININL